VSVSAAFAEFTLLRQSIGTEYGFPLGQWQAEGILIGDASGGDVTLLRLFDRAYIYSWEGVSGDKPATSGDSFQLNWFPFLTASAVAWTQSAVFNVVGTQSVVAVRDQTPNLPLSAQNPTGVVQAQVIMGANVIGGVFSAKIWGNYWDKRAYLTRSGPIRR